MGSVCCAAAKDGSVYEPGSEILHISVGHSPLWGFPWDNQGHVAGEDSSLSLYSDRFRRNDGLENKSETSVQRANASQVGNRDENFQSVAWAKSSLSEGSSGKRKTPISDSYVARSISMEVKGATEFPAGSNRSLTKLSPVMSSRKPLTRQASASQSPRVKSPSSNKVTRDSHRGSSDNGYMHGFPESAQSYRERWSFDSEALIFNRIKTVESSRQSSSSLSINLQICRFCSKLLTEKSAFSSHKMVANHDFSVVAVLICGHVYHAECLEHMTPDINRYDPSCPVCTLGEHQVLKLSEKVLKAEMDSKARKRLKTRAVDGDLDALNHSYGPKMASSSSTKSSSGTPFLKRHFSFESKGSKSTTESNSAIKKGFFGAKSTKY